GLERVLAKCRVVDERLPGNTIAADDDARRVAEALPLGIAALQRHAGRAPGDLHQRRIGLEPEFLFDALMAGRTHLDRPRMEHAEVGQLDVLHVAGRLVATRRGLARCERLEVLAPALRHY